MTDREKILFYLDEIHERSGGHNGARLEAISDHLNLSTEETKTLLNKMFAEDLIQVRSSFNYKIVMLNA